MQPDALDVLVCPRKEGDRACQGTLRVKRLLSRWKNDPREILEAILRCERCERTYPVVCGIPILHEELPKYLRHHYYFLVGCCEALKALSDAMKVELLNWVLLDLKSPQEELFPPQRRYTRETVIQFLAEAGPYLCNHYDDLSAIVEPDDPLRAFLQPYPSRNPHAVLETFAARHTNGAHGIAVDIGCSVGGFTALQSQRSQRVFGVDVSFEHLLLASQILKGRPRRLEEYRLYREGQRYARRTLQARRCRNVEFVVATGRSLPFRTSSVDAVSSCNVVDIVQEPLELLDEKTRVLKRRGLLLLSDPYEFYGARWKRLRSKTRKSPLEVVRERIERAVTVVEEEDGVPWISQHYNRHYMIYYNHCLAGIKGGGVKPHRPDGRNHGRS